MTARSPGTEGDKVQSRVIRERLLREAEGNVALKITEGDDKDSFEVAGRGELQLGILIETMRREGFELTIGKPRVVYRYGPDGEKLEPIEEVDHRRRRRACRHRHREALRAAAASSSRCAPPAAAARGSSSTSPTRGLIGYQPELLSDTRGTAVFNRLFHAYEPFRGDIPGRRNGVLISNAQGEAVAYALWYLEDRGADDDRSRHARLSRA